MNRSHWSNPPMATFSFAAHNRFVTPSSICESWSGFDFRQKDRHGSVRGASCGLPVAVGFSTMNLNFRRRECPLWVISGHWSASTRCPLYPQKRTSNISSCKVYTFRSLNCSLVHAIWPLVWAGKQIMIVVLSWIKFTRPTKFLVSNTVNTRRVWGRQWDFSCLWSLLLLPQPCSILQRKPKIIPGARNIAMAWAGWIAALRVFSSA